MKKLVSIFVLVGIVLSSFFTSETLAPSTNHFTYIHASNSSNLKNLHKRLVLLELTNETEDSEQSSANGLDCSYFSDIVSEIIHVKNVINSTLIAALNDQLKLNPSSLFIVIRSIRI